LPTRAPRPHKGARLIQEVAHLRCHVAEAGWRTKYDRIVLRTGNPLIVRPSVLVIYREDHKFLLDAVIPKPGRIFEH
jgi:hypothetical protein